jgi:hypothetical protein
MNLKDVSRRVAEAVHRVQAHPRTPAGSIHTAVQVSPQKVTLPELAAMVRLCERLNDGESADELVRYAAQLVQHGFYTATQMFQAFDGNERVCHALLPPAAVLHLKRRGVDQAAAHLETGVAVADACQQKTWVGAVRRALGGDCPVLLAWCRDGDRGWAVWMLHKTARKPEGVALPTGWDREAQTGRDAGYVMWVTHDAVRPREPGTWATGRTFVDDDDEEFEAPSSTIVSALNCYGVNFPPDWSEYSANHHKGGGTLG